MMYIQKWAYCPDGNHVVLVYSNGENSDILFVKKEDFNRAFMTIVNAGYEAVKKEFAVNIVTV